MQRFTGWLLLIVVLCGLGVLMYQDMRLRTERTEIPSAITAGSPEGPGDEPEAAAPVLGSRAPSPVDGGNASVAETPPAGEPPARSVASVEPPPGAETRAAADTPSASVDAPTSLQPSAGSDAATPPASAAAAPDMSTAAGGAADVADVPAAESSTTEPPAVTIETAEATSAPTEEAPPASAPLASGPDQSATDDPAPEAAVAPGTDPAPDVATAPAPEGALTGADPAPLAPAPGAEDATEVAVAPEIEAKPQPETPPESESSGRGSMMQASPSPEPAMPDPAETAIAAVDPTADVEVPQPAAAPDPIAPGTDSQSATAPTFDVVRIEPTGDAVVAGVASPGATVELFAGAMTLATTIASEAGDWAIALDRPLPAGPHDLGLRATSKDTGVVIESEQRVAVLVPETVAEEPLVVLNAPNAASTILQVPAAPGEGEADVAALDAPDVAPASPDGEGATVAPATAPGAGAPIAPADAASPADPPMESEVAVGTPLTEPPASPAGAGADASDPVAPADADVAASAAPPGESEVAVATPAEEPPAAASTTAAADTNDQAPADAEVAVAPVAEPPGTEPAPAAPEPAASGTEQTQDVAVAAPEPEPQPEPEPVVESVVAVTAVEAESSGALFVAGTATTPEDVRVYVDDVLLGEATPSPSGTWLIEVMRELPAGTYRVRADQVEPGAGTVLARAEVPFEREVEVAILRPVAETGGGSGAEATGTMAGPTTLIIKRSDNLWRISRQFYGKGIRWSTIYEANKDQIRNPRFIYPGQVFILPEGNAAWAEDEGGASE